jgi:hypothetical protein
MGVKPEILESPECRAGVSEQFSDKVVTNFDSLAIEKNIEEEVGQDHAGPLSKKG